ncbi:magnesium ABC transporter ATPase [Brucella neotomae]|nr:magnesium ABC transporter ATPase [Brucella neotomae]
MRSSLPLPMSEAGATGLTEGDAITRLYRDGPNEVARERRIPALVQFALAFKNPFIMVLVVLGAISAFTDIWVPLETGEEADPTKVIIIAVMVLASALMRFIQEYRSGRAAEALKAMVRTTATVWRRVSAGTSSAPREIPMRELVVAILCSFLPGI